MKALALAASLILQPIIDREGGHSTFADFGCSDPLYCEEFTGVAPYADAAETLVDNVTCDAAYAPYRCGPAYPLVTLYLPDSIWSDVPQSFTRKPFAPASLN